MDSSHIEVFAQQISYPTVVLIWSKNTNLINSLGRWKSGSFMDLRYKID